MNFHWCYTSLDTKLSRGGLKQPPDALVGPGVCTAHRCSEDDARGLGKVVTSRGQVCFSLPTVFVDTLCFQSSPGFSLQHFKDPETVLCLFGLFLNYPSMGSPRHSIHRWTWIAPKKLRKCWPAKRVHRRRHFLNEKWTWTENSLIIELCAGIDGAGSTSGREGGPALVWFCHVKGDSILIGFNDFWVGKRFVSVDATVTELYKRRASMSTLWCASLNQRRRMP